MNLKARYMLYPYHQLYIILRFCTHQYALYVRFATNTLG